MSACRWLDGFMGRWMGVHAYAQRDEQMDGQVGGHQRNKWIWGWVDGLWMNGCTDGRRRMVECMKGKTLTNKWVDGQKNRWNGGCSDM